MAARVQRFVRGPAAVRANRVHVQLRDLPRTVLPSDIRRACAHAKLTPVVSKIELDYANFEPRGIAFITLDSSLSVARAVPALSASSICGFPLNASSSPPPLSFTRSRGIAGRKEAADRGILTGDGPSGGIIANGLSVVITGLPGKMTTGGLKYWLRNFKLAGDTAEEKEIIRIEPPDKVFSFVSKHLIRLSSISEAHRMVRKLHQTFYEPDVHGMRYPVRARIIY